MCRNEEEENLLCCGVLIDLCQRGEILGRPVLWDGWLVKQRDDDTTDLSLGQHHTGSRIHSSYNNSIRTQYKGEFEVKQECLRVNDGMVLGKERFTI